MYLVVTLAPELVRARRFTFLDMSNKQACSEISFSSESSSRSSSQRASDLDHAVATVISSSLGDLTDKLTSIIDTRLDSLKHEIQQENSATVEEAIVRSKTDKYQFNKKGNQQQFEHEEAVL